MDEVIVSAPGKVILAGEHAVVYGYSALVASIDRRLIVRLKPNKKDRTVIKTKVKNLSLVNFALSQILKKGQTVNLKIESDLPANRGLGSSAALATGLVWALMKNSRQAEKDKMVKRIEDHQHGNSSGVDQTIVREGGVIKYVKNKGFTQVNMTLPQMILIDSGQPQESTGEMVRLVAQEPWTRQLKQVGKLVDNWKPQLIAENEALLEKIGVVGQKAKAMIRQIEGVGGMAKICGAGGVKSGSGTLLAHHKDINKLKQLADKSNWPHLPAVLGAEGVRYES